MASKALIFHISHIKFISCKVAAILVHSYLFLLTITSQLGKREFYIDIKDITYGRNGLYLIIQTAEASY